MPWTEDSDLEKYKKGMTSKQKKKWVAIANNVLKNCDKSPDECEASAIRIANSKVEESLNSDGDMSNDDIRRLLQDALNKTMKSTDPLKNPWIYVEDVWEDELVYTKDNQPYKCSYVIDDNGIVTFGVAVKVVRKTTYEQVESGKDQWMEVQNVFTGDVIALSEKEVSGSKNNIVPIKIIKPGWGSSGYYPADMLKRDGSKVFKKGIKMFWNHPTVSEESERPERNLRDLAGELVEDAQWKNDGLYGSGLYARAKIFSPFQDAVKELTPHIGVSIRASGKAQEGEADGQKGMIIEEITNAASIDFVTAPGAGGKILELFESYRDPDQIKKGKEMAELKELQEANVDLTEKLKKSGEDLTKAQADIAEKEKELQAAQDELAKHAEAQKIKDAAAFVEKELKDSQLPEMTKTRLVEKLSKNPPLTEEKKLDEVKFKELIAAEVIVETEYLTKVLGSGKIIGLGESADGSDGKTLEEAFKELYTAQGIPEAQAIEMAKTAKIGA